MTAEMGAIEQAECNLDVGLCQGELALPRLVEAKWHCCDMWEIHMIENRRSHGPHDRCTEHSSNATISVKIDRPTCIYLTVFCPDSEWLEGGRACC
jgi:hypothetical protein